MRNANDRGADRIDELLAAAGRRPSVTVIGECDLDRWVIGRATRLSRDAPVAVVEEGEVHEQPGGAANTAANLAALGAEVRLITVVGDDRDGVALLGLLEEAGVDTTGALLRADVVTVTKTRVVGDGQVLLRVDRGGHDGAPDSAQAAFQSALAQPLEAQDALVVCDYGLGLFSPDAAAALAGIPRPPVVTVDARRPDRWRALRADVTTPNAAEASALLPEPLRGDRVAAAANQQERLLDATGAAAVIVTLDRDGTVLLRPGRSPHRTRTRPAPEHRAAGAGDTFAAALTVGLTGGMTMERAAEAAQRAAEIVLARDGTSVCSRADLLALSSRTVGTPVDDLAAEMERRRARGDRIVFTNGCFDVLHLGHIASLRQAKGLGDVLVVGVNDDESVRRLKGPGRPVTPLAERCAVLQELECVDHVVVFGQDAPLALIRTLRPDVYAKGGDYVPEMLAETPVVESYGGAVRILDYVPGHSTSSLVERLSGRSRRR